MADNEEYLGINDESVKAFRPSRVANTKKYQLRKHDKGLTRSQRIDLMAMAYEEGLDLWTLEPLLPTEARETAKLKQERTR